MAEQLQQMLVGSATAASKMLRSLQISSRELTQLALARIDDAMASSAAAASRSAAANR